MLLVDRFGDDTDPYSRPVCLEIASDRDHHEVVLGIAKNAAQRFGHTDYLVWPVLNLNRLTDRIDSFEEADSNVGTDEGYRGVAARLFRGDAVSTVHLNIVDRGYILAHTLNVDSHRRGPQVADSGLPGGHNPDAFHQRGFG